MTMADLWALLSGTWFGGVLIGWTIGVGGIALGWKLARQLRKDDR